MSSRSCLVAILSRISSLITAISTAADSPVEGDGFELSVPPGETPRGPAMWFPPTARQARRGTDPVRDEKFESGFLQRGVCSELIFRLSSLVCGME
jgi:hypothetical protein